MYEKHFGFHRQPFQAAAPAEAFVVSECIAAIQPRLLRCLRSGLGLALVTGLSGCGKTALLRSLQRTLQNDGRAILVSGASLDSQQTLRQVLMHAALRQAGSATHSAELTEPLTTWRVIEQLHQSLDFWGPVVLLLDDLHLVPVPILNELRGLSEESSQGRRLLRVIGTAPASFELECSRPDYEYFRSGIRCSEFLQPLSMEESLEFLNRHLRCCGGDAAEVFSATAGQLVLQTCAGLPASLAVLADECLAVAAERNQHVVDPEIIRSALQRLRHLAYQWDLGVLDDDWQEDEEDSAAHEYAPAGDDEVVEIVGLPDEFVSSTAESVTAETQAETQPAAEVELSRTSTGYSVEVGYCGDDDAEQTDADSAAAEIPAAATAHLAIAPGAEAAVNEMDGSNPPSAAEPGNAGEPAMPDAALRTNGLKERFSSRGIQDAQVVATSDDAIAALLRNGAGSGSAGWFTLEAQPPRQAVHRNDQPETKNPVNGISAKEYSPEMLSIVQLRGRQSAAAEIQADKVPEDPTEHAAFGGDRGERDERLTHLFTRLRRLQEMSRRSS